jgi:hypothetical protein
MSVLSALGLLAGGFLLVPKGVWVVPMVWGVTKANPVLGVTLLGLWSLLERWL